MQELIAEAENLTAEIKRIQKPRTGNTADIRDQIEGVWNVNEVIKEMFALSDKFIDYRVGGILPLPSTKLADKECTFHPVINRNSV